MHLPRASSRGVPRSAGECRASRGCRVRRQRASAARERHRNGRCAHRAHPRLRPISGAHFNPAVTLVDAWQGDISRSHVGPYAWPRFSAHAPERRLSAGRSDCRPFSHHTASAAARRYSQASSSQRWVWVHTGLRRPPRLRIQRVPSRDRSRIRSPQPHFSHISCRSPNCTPSRSSSRTRARTKKTAPV